MYRFRIAAAALVVAAVAATSLAGDKGTILVTGFEPFQGPLNPSWQAVKGLDGKCVNGYTIAAVELPVEWKRGAERLEHKIRDLRPVAVISFGEGSVGRFELEEVAHDHVNPNLTDNKQDKFKKKKIKKDGPEEYRSTLPLSEIEAVVKALLPPDANLEVLRSQDPGGYLCEYVFYLGHYFMQKYKLDGPQGFIHVPYSGGGTTRTDFTIDQQVVGAAVQALADHLDAKWQSEHPPAPPADTRGFGGSLSSIGEVNSGSRH